MSNAKPDHVLYIVIPAEKQGDKGTWMKIGAVWTARVGYSIKPEPLLTLYAPFNVPGIGMAMMPVNDEQNRNGRR